MQFCKGPINLHVGRAPPRMEHAAAPTLKCSMVPLHCAPVHACCSEWSANLQLKLVGGVLLSTAA